MAVISYTTSHAPNFHYIVKSEPPKFLHLLESWDHEIFQDVSVHVMAWLQIFRGRTELMGTLYAYAIKKKLGLKS